MSIKIKKGKYESDFTTVPNNTFQRIDMSWKAKGLLIYLLTLPDDWEIYKKDLSKRSSDGYDLTDSAFKELQSLGFIIEDGEKRKDGMFCGKSYLVYPVPNSVTDGENPERLPMGKIPNGTDGENPDLHNIHNTTPYSRSIKTKKTLRFSPPILSEVEAFFREKGVNEILARKAFEHYESGNWLDSKGNKVKNWKQKMLTNWINTDSSSNYKIKSDDLFNQESDKPKMVY